MTAKIETLPVSGGPRPPPDSDDELQQEIAAVLASYDREGDSGTPDHILARVMLNALYAFEEGLVERAKWYGAPIELPKKET